jgi:Protein of unknown function (DUF664)
VDERDELLAALAHQRRHLHQQVVRLSPTERRTAVLPSDWTPLGLLRHVTLSVETYWFHAVLGGTPFSFFPKGPRADWLIPEGVSDEDVLEDFEKACARADEILATCDPAAPPAFPDPLWEDWGVTFPTVRSVLLHVLTELAAHAGQLDVVVETLTTRQWLVMD